MGGVVNAKVVLLGRHDVGGLWLAFWFLGNLARHTYMGSANHIIWPWGSSACTDKGRMAQLVSTCNCIEHYRIHAGHMRGVPEINIFEVPVGNVPANTGPFLHMPVGQLFFVDICCCCCSSSSFFVAVHCAPHSKISERQQYFQTVLYLFLPSYLFCTAIDIIFIPCNCSCNKLC